MVQSWLSELLGGSVASKISYQGRLSDGQGEPLDGEVDRVFQLWDVSVGGDQIGGDMILRDVPVADGLFTVELAVPQEAFHGQALWLQVQVEGQVLMPRQELLPVPYALSLKPGAQIYGSLQAALYLGSGSEDGIVGETDASDKAGGLGPAIYSEGDLYITGTIRGNLPREGGSFPRAAYDSGVQCMETQHYMDLDPGLPKPAYNPYNFG